MRYDSCITFFESQIPATQTLWVPPRRRLGKEHTNYTPCR